MWTQVRLFLFALFLIPMLDYVWLAKIMSGFYLAELGSLARTENGQFKPLLWPAFVVYVLLALGLVAFVLSWVDAWPQALGWAALFGLLVYGVYDMTNLSIVQGYSLRLSLLDMAWGATLCGTVGVAMYFLRQALQ